MSTLHTFPGSPAKSRDALARCLAALSPGDSLLLLEDAVYAALQDIRLHDEFTAIPEGTSLHVLSEDLAARGISAKIRPVFSSVTYKEFVRLCLAHGKVVNWS